VHDHFDVLGVKIDVTNLQSACQFMEGKLKTRKSVYICIAPVATIVDCQKNDEYLKVVNNSAMTTPDGMPLVWLGKFKGNSNIDRTYGPDLLRDMCLLSERKSYTHYFYGGTQETSDLLAGKLREKYPKLKIVGRYSPPFRDSKALEESRIIDEINQANPDILWVGLGSPKQDYWMFQHKDKLKVGVMIGVGAAFDFMAETKRQAPRWIQRSGLEWVFRLCSEPKRLWRRYLIGNTLFIYYLLKNKLFLKRT